MILNISIILYFIIGVLLSSYIWKRDYAKEYKIAKESDNVQDGMVCMFMLFLIVFWPLRAINEIIEKLKYDKRRQNKS